MHPEVDWPNAWEGALLGFCAHTGKFRMLVQSAEGFWMHLRKPSLTGIVAILALFIALGGSAAAAGHYLITNSNQIKPSVLKKLKGNAGVNGAAGQAGAAGATGPQGPAGPAGPSNLSALTTVIGPTVEVPAGKVGGAEAVCPAGSRAVSGGGDASIAGIADSEMETSHTSWFIIMVNETGIVLKIHAAVQCAGAGQAVAANLSRPTHARLDQRVAELTATVEASKR
jgi:hypothetical protein